MRERDRQDAQAREQDLEEERKAIASSELVVRVAVRSESAKPVTANIATAPPRRERGSTRSTTTAKRKNPTRATIGAICPRSACACDQE